MRKIKKEILLVWAVNYARHKDIIANEITAIDKKEDAVIVKKGERQEIYLIMPVIEDISSVNKEETTIIVASNNQKSLDFVAGKWKELSEMPKLKIIFVNPDSLKDKKWILAPYVHNRICDTKSLKTGLKSMFGGVDEVMA